MLFLIYTYSPTHGRCVYISGRALLPVLYLTLRSTEEVKFILHLVVIACCGQINPQKLCKQTHLYKQQQNVCMRADIYMYLYMRFTICTCNLT